MYNITNTLRNLKSFFSCILLDELYVDIFYMNIRLHRNAYFFLINLGDQNKYPLSTIQRLN